MNLYLLEDDEAIGIGLKYSLENMLSVQITDSTDLKTAVQNYFVNKGFITQSQVDGVVKKLK